MKKVKAVEAASSEINKLLELRRADLIANIQIQIQLLECETEEAILRESTPSWFTGEGFIPMYCGRPLFLGPILLERFDLTEFKTMLTVLRDDVESGSCDQFLLLPGEMVVFVDDDEYDLEIEEQRAYALKRAEQLYSFFQATQALKRNYDFARDAYKEAIEKFMSERLTYPEQDSFESQQKEFIRTCTYFDWPYPRLADFSESTEIWIDFLEDQKLMLKIEFEELGMVYSEHSERVTLQEKQQP
jgi:hypothetical protein